MTTLGKTKLTDTQLIALSGAAQRQDAAVSLPDRIKGMAAKKLATSLMDKGFVREIRAKPGMPAWRRDEDGRTYALVITKLGRAAIRVTDEGKTSMDAMKGNGLPSPRSHKGRRPLASASDRSDAGVDHVPDHVSARKRDAARAQSSNLASCGSQSTNGQSVSSPRRGTKLAEVLALLQGVGDGRVDVIVVYKVDRLTRSLADFAKLVELFDAHEASFVSVTQSFNTTSSMGRLTLNVLLSFAQFEREVIGERVRDKIAASKRKGLWVGGPVPLGYRTEAKKLVVVPNDAEAVRIIFTRYLALGSFGMLIDDLDRLGIKPRNSKLGRFMVGPLAHMLKNRFYIGEVAYRGEVHEGEHAPIIDKELFLAVQAKLQERAVDRRVRRSRSPSFLSGLIYDDRDNRMSPSHANKRGVRYRYYVSQAVLQNRKTQAGSIMRASAPDVEELVVAAVRHQFGAPGLSDRDLVALHIARIVLRPRHIEVTIREPDPASHQLAEAGDDCRADMQDERADGRSQSPSLLTIPWVPVGAKARKGIAFEPAGGQSLDPVARDTLLTAIARARCWMDDLVEGRVRSFQEIAKIEGKVERHIRYLAPLAYLSPGIVEAIENGTAPAGLTVTSLARALPHSWAEQEQKLCIS